MKIGLLFGTFDPIHNGHIEIANNLLLKKNLDKIWLVVTPQNPFKKGHIQASQKHRLEMAKMATYDYSHVLVSDIESELTFPQYTSNTLRYLNNLYLDYEFQIIMGEDNYISLLKYDWKDSNYILNNFIIYVYQRNNCINFKEKVLEKLTVNLLPNHIQLPGEMINLSSSLIRELIFNYNREHRLAPPPPNHLLLAEASNFLPKNILEYILNKNLYTD